MANKNWIPEMEKNNETAIMSGLQSSAALQRVNGIIFSVRFGHMEESFIRRIEYLKQDETCLFGHNAGYTVSHFATAALDILGIQTYDGEEQEVKNLIGCKMKF